MNYLAHIFLSHNIAQIQIGNFIGDFVKGKNLKHFPKQMANGIVLHRKIDEYTDAHPAVREAVIYLRPTFGRYSAIILDMYFDYFLAKNFKKYSPQKSLFMFCKMFYINTLINYRHLPHKVQGFILHFVFSNRLQKYKSLNGLKQSLEIMEKYKSNAINPSLTISFLETNHEVLEKFFHLFMPDVIQFTKNNISNNVSK